MRKFLSCPFLLLLPLLFCSCGRINEQRLMIDSADTCRVTKDQKITLISNGQQRDYHMPSTKDFFNGKVLFSSSTPADSGRIYIYRCDNKFAASRINIEHARALRNAVAAGKYSPADILPSCALWFLAAFVHRMRRILLPSNRQTDHDNRRLHPGHAVFCFHRRENLVFCHGRNTLGKRRFMHSS